MLEKLKRWRWAVLVALLMVAGLAFAFWPTATPVDMAEVTRGPMAVGVTDDGVTRAKDVYIVAAPVTGYLSRIELEAGDEVAAGQLISRMTSRLSAPLDPRSEQDLRGALAAAQAAAAGSEAALGQAQRDLARSEELSQRGFLPLAQLEATRTRVSTEQARVQQSRAEANRIRSLLAQPQGPGAGAPVPVRAPVAGSVLSVLRESEGVIAEGTELVAIGNAQSIEVVVDLLSREAVPWPLRSPSTARRARSRRARRHAPAVGAADQELGMVGTKFGCGMGMCGACTVHVDGQAHRSCSLPGRLDRGRR
jgi:HlyD family secretion protein